MLLDPTARVQELDEDLDHATKGDADQDDYWTAANDVPDLYCLPPLLHDDLQTLSSQAQDKVAEECRQLLSGEVEEIDDLNSHGIPALHRAKHLKFIRRNLENYASGYQAMDASRAWIVYWALAGLSHLGEDASHYRDRAIQTFGPLQNDTGGFGPETSHVAASYAATLSLAIVDGLDLVNRRAM